MTSRPLKTFVRSKLNCHDLLRPDNSMTTEYDKTMTTEFAELGPIQFPRSYTPGRKAGVDQDTTVQCVPTYDEAHAAREHGNDVGIQIEVCGKAGQSATQWADDASQGAIRQAARVAVLLRKKYPGRFPLAKISPAELRAGKDGFAGHKDATMAWFSDGGTHTDPGPRFPWAELFALIKAAEKAANNATEDDELTPAQMAELATMVADKVVTHPLGRSGPNLGMDIEKIETIAADVADIKARLDSMVPPA
jgi:hypothetical protein